MTDIPATYGKLEFHANKATTRKFKLPKKGWYAWRSDMDSLQALRCDALKGPFADEDEAKQFANSNYYEAEQ